MLYDVDPMDIKIITETLLDSNLKICLYLAYTHKSERQWIINSCKHVDYVVLNLSKHDLLKGYILNYSNVMYYNNTQDIKQLNINVIKDPIDFTLRLINERRQKLSM